MESADGFTNAVLQARLSGAKRDSQGWEEAYNQEKSNHKATIDETWYWVVIFRALRSLFWELSKRYPDDPLFKLTGGKRPNGDREMEYHRVFDRFVAVETKALPATVSRGNAFLSFLRKTKV